MEKIKMTTIQDVIGDYTPLSNNVLKKLKLVRGALACKIFFTSNLADRVCRMGLTRISDELGMVPSTASKNINWLVNNGYVELVKRHTATEPAQYRCTQKFYDIAKGIDLINTPIDLINRGIDLINQEEESKEESEKDSITIDNALKEIDQLVKTNFAKPDRNKDFRDDLQKTIIQYGPDQVLDAIKIALSPDRQNGKPKSWGYVKGILQRTEKDGQSQNSAENTRQKKSRGKGRETTPLSRAERQSLGLE